MASAYKDTARVQISQSTLSHHMKILCDSGIVQGRKKGKWVHYSLDPAGVKRAKVLLDKQLTLTTPSAQNECCCPTNK